MKYKSMSRSWIVVTAMLAICTVAAGRAAIAQEPSAGSAIRNCANRMLFGDYGALIEGMLLDGNAPLRTASMMHFDGRGNVTTSDYVVHNGMPLSEDWQPKSGTYWVNPDCTATFILEGVIKTHFVVVNNGKEFRGVVDGDAITFQASRVN